MLAEEGETVSAGKPVVVINAGAVPEVVVAVPESLVGRLSRGQTASVTFDAFKGTALEATITEVGVSANDRVSTYPVTLTLAEKNTKVRSGMAAKVTLHLGSAGEKKKIYVSPRAVGEDLKGRFVFLVTPADKGFGVVKRKNVVVGEIVAAGLEVKSGVEPGALVVNAGLRFLSDGQQVRLLGAAPSLSETPAAPASGAPAPSGSR